MGSYVYLVQPQNLLGTDVYKIGHSQQPNTSRHKQYGKNYILIAQVAVSNSSIIEQRLINVFRKKYACYRPNEYFRGNVAHMLKDFLSVVNEDIFHQSMIQNWRTNQLEKMPAYWILKWVQEYKPGWWILWNTKYTPEQWWDIFTYKTYCNNKTFNDICFQHPDRYYTKPLFDIHGSKYSLIDVKDIRLV
jgi:hypothetical protein